MTETLNKLHDFFALLLIDKPHFHGKVEVNFFDGKVPNVNVIESVKLTDKRMDEKKP
ncbi:MAG: hypothetical protein Q7T18_06725 [Sedimentisphaerales bacterium]|nr:hypothetical protein [Sedimentisphaerales bacterium]